MTTVADTLRELELPLGEWYLAADSGHVGFDVKTMWGFATVKGRFDRYEGVLRTDSDTATAELTIESASLDTGHAKRDEHLRSADFFNVAEHPSISFKSRDIATRAGGVLVTGDLTIGSTSIPMTLPVEVASTGPSSLTLRTETTVPREAANLAWNKLGMIRGDAQLRVELELVKDA